MVEFEPEANLLAEIKVKKEPQEWLYQLKHSPFYASRVRAAKALSLSTLSADARNTLQQILFDKKTHRYLRSKVAYTLGRSAEAEDCKLLQRARTSVQSSYVRIAAVRGLRHCENAIDALKAALLDKSTRVRTAAIYAIAKRKHKTSFDLLTQAYAQEYSSDAHRIKSAALYGMVELKDKRASSFLEKAMQRGQHHDLRVRAFLLYARWANTQNLSPHIMKRHKDIVFEKLVKYLSSPDAFIQQSIVDALKKLGNQKAIPHLRRFVAKAILPRHKDAVRKAIQHLQRASSSKTGLKPGQMKRLEKKLLRRLEKKLMRKLKRKLDKSSKKVTKGASKISKPVQKQPMQKIDKILKKNKTSPKNLTK